MTFFAFVIGGAFAVALYEAVSQGALTRRLWRELLRGFNLLDLGAMALVRRLVPPRYILRGACHRCGVCCQQIIAAPPRFIRETWGLRLFLLYHRVAHRFHKVGDGPDGVIILSCGHLSPEGRCRVYRFRPLLCRNYPEQPLYTPPRLLPGCGFSVAPRVVLAMTSRPSLRILNPRVVVFHPTPDVPPKGEADAYLLVDDSPRDSTL